jgi:DNA-binding transcriptional MocR family regulator
MLTSIRGELEQRRKIVVDILGDRIISGAAGAMYVWVELPPQWSPSEFAASAQAIGIKLTPGNAFAMDPLVKHQAFRACLGPAPTQTALREAFERLRTLMDARKSDDHQTIA